jgi:hypothetical protein
MFVLGELVQVNLEQMGMGGNVRLLVTLAIH